MKAGKTILLISPQAWGPVFVSKHHYAIALEQLGYNIYFLNPPNKNDKPVIEITKPYENKNLFVVAASFSDNLFLRYHANIIYAVLVKAWIKRVLKKLPAIDIVWCFETNIFRDLSIFKKSKRIFHVVDPVNEKLTGVAKTADLTVCISNRILKQFDGMQVKKIFINHALSAIAIQQSKAIDLTNYRPPARPRVGYIGNLSRAIIDTRVIQAIVLDNPAIDFHFWGPGTESNLGGETLILIESLQHLKNVFFHPPIPSAELIDTIRDMDIFLLAYKNIEGVYDGSNSHKLLEYLATGKVVVATYIDQYSAATFYSLLQMSRDGENDKLPAVFKSVAGDIAFWNTSDNMQKRRDFATGQSYTTNATRILALSDE